MKLKVLAVAVAATFAFPMVAQAELASTMSIDGDIGVFYSDSADALGELGTEINFDGSAEQDGITYMGHMEFDVNGTGNSLRVDEVRVGAKGGFGEVWLGEVDDACDQFDPGSNDIWLGGQSNSCVGNDVNNIMYKNKMGAVEYAVSHNPSSEISALGLRAEVAQGVKVNLGYQTIDGITNNYEDYVISYGIAGSFAGIDLNAEGNDADDWGLNASYSANGNTFWLGYGDDGSADDRIGVGYRRSHGKMDYIIEHKEQGDDDETIVGMRYRF